MSDEPDRQPASMEFLGGGASQPPDSRIQGGSIRLFRVWGINVWLHWSWLFFAVLRLQPTVSDDSFGIARYGSRFWYVAEYLTLFGFVLLHEFGHVLACRAVGGVANRIVLWPLGGVAFVDPPPRPLASLWTIAAGPLVNVVLLAPTIGFWWACRRLGYEQAAPDVYWFAFSIAWLNGLMLAFNLLPVYPLDGGKILQAILWLAIGRAWSTLAAAVVGLLTAAGMFVFAIVEGSLTWGIIAGFGMLFCLGGFLSARAMLRLRDLPRRKESACPACAAAPPIGLLWGCSRCRARFDVFAAGGDCPLCSAPQPAVLCHDCGRARPFMEWRPEVISLDSFGPPSGQSPPATPPLRPPTAKERVVCGAIFAAAALVLFGLPNAEKEPLSPVLWTIGGAVFGATSAGAMTRSLRRSQALKKLRGAWRLVEENGQDVRDTEQSRLLVVRNAAYTQQDGDESDVRGTIWIDPQAEPPAISFLPKTGPDAGMPSQGIYLLQGKLLTICLALPGRARPNKFTAQLGVQQVRTYRRGKASD